MTTKTIYLPTVYVDETTGEIIEKEQLKNLSYKSKLITNIEKNGTTKRKSLHFADFFQDNILIIIYLLK